MKPSIFNTTRLLGLIDLVHMWTVLSESGVCSGARASECGSIYDPDDLSGWRGPLPTERRKHRHHFQTKVTIQPEQQHCPCEYIHIQQHMCTTLWPYVRMAFFLSTSVFFLFFMFPNEERMYVATCTFFVLRLRALWVEHFWTFQKGTGVVAVALS